MRCLNRDMRVEVGIKEGSEEFEKIRVTPESCWPGKVLEKSALSRCCYWGYWNGEHLNHLHGCQSCSEYWLCIYQVPLVEPANFLPLTS